LTIQCSKNIKNVISGFLLSAALEVATNLRWYCGFVDVACTVTVVDIAAVAMACVGRYSPDYNIRLVPEGGCQVGRGTRRNVDRRRADRPGVVASERYHGTQL